MPEASVVQIARAFAWGAHLGQKRDGGEAYITHPARVAAAVDGDHAKAAAWLHDVLEDTPATIDDLRAVAVPEDVIEAVVLLTHANGERLIPYWRRIKTDPIARMVKIADMRDNLSTLGFIDSEQRRARISDKYADGLMVLEG